MRSIKHKQASVTCGGMRMTCTRELVGKGHRRPRRSSAFSKHLCPRALSTHAGAVASCEGSFPARKPVWIDCDPGHDDAIALMLACKHPSLEVQGVSTVACNQTVEKTTANALAVLHAIGHGDIDVYQGQAKPLMQSHVHCAEIHGETGLDGLGGGRLFPDSPQKQQPENAVLALADAIHGLEEDGKLPLQLICTGALTNAALLFTLYPKFASAEYINLTSMGGALGIGNTGPVQEFNIMTDPHAASIVFNCGVPVTMVPTEVTHTVLASPNIVHRISCLGTPFSACVVDLLMYFTDTYKSVFKFDSPPVHDAVAVVYVIQPQSFQTQAMRVDVEVCSSLSKGQTVCDVWGHSNLPTNVEVARKVDAASCWDLIIDAIEHCNDSSTIK
eukprot:jgi/Ulvmu1/5152/UM021_0169.1